MEKPKDPKVKFRSCMVGKTKTGNADRFQLYLGGGNNHDPEQLLTLIDALNACVENPKGVKLDLQIYANQSEDGRSFHSAQMYVKPVSDGPTGGGGVRTNYVPRTAATTQNNVPTRDEAVSKSRVARVREQLGG